MKNQTKDRNQVAGYILASPAPVNSVTTERVVSMKENIAHTIKFTLENCQSYEGTLVYKIQYDNLLGEWSLNCGEFALLIGAEDVPELIAELSKV